MNIELVENPTQNKMHRLIQEAQICLALAANPSGVKLKLINSLFNARYVISDDTTLTGSGLDALVYKKDNVDLIALIDDLMQQSFTQNEIDLRKKLLLEKYDNLKNAQQIINSFV